MEDNKDLISSINWNNIINVDARSIDRASLGKVQGLFEPCVVVENGNLVKETYYIPKSVIENYDHEALYFRLTEQEVKDNCIRDSPPSEEDAEQMRITAERIASTQRSIVLHSENQEEDVLRKLMEAVSEFKDKISSGAKRAKEKIEENQIQKDEQRISKMGELATTFTDSFDRVMSEIKTTHTYAEQAQIYDGFMKLLEQQRELVSARKELASRVKSSVKEPLSSDSQENNTESPERREAQNRDIKERRKIASMEPTAQKVEFVLPTNVAPSTTSMTTTPTSNNNKNKVYQENQFMVIEPPAIKYCKVAIKPTQKRTKKEKEKKNDFKNPS